MRTLALTIPLVAWGYARPALRKVRQWHKDNGDENRSRMTRTGDLVVLTFTGIQSSCAAAAKSANEVGVEARKLADAGGSGSLSFDTILAAFNASMGKGQGW